MRLESRRWVSWHFERYLNEPGLRFLPRKLPGPPRPAGLLRASVSGSHEIVLAVVADLADAEGWKRDIEQRQDLLDEVEVEARRCVVTSSGTAPVPCLQTSVCTLGPMDINSPVGSRRRERSLRSLVESRSWRA